MALLLEHPLWLVAIIVTIVLHVAFVIVIRRLMRRDRDDTREP